MKTNKVEGKGNNQRCYAPDSQLHDHNMCKLSAVGPSKWLHVAKHAQHSAAQRSATHHRCLVHHSVPIALLECREQRLKLQERETQ